MPAPAESPQTAADNLLIRLSTGYCRMGLAGGNGSSSARRKRRSRRYTSRMRNTRLLIAAAVAGTLLSCGQKGPLLLPDAQHPHKKIGVGKPAATPATSAPSGNAPQR